MKNYDFDIVHVFKYITEGNAPVYRPIMRFLYEKHLSAEYNTTTLDEIYQLLIEHKVIDSEYSETNVKEALRTLEKWEAISSDKTKGRGVTVEEFKRNRYTYQLTSAGVEIESMLIRWDELDEQLIGGLKSKQFSLLLKHMELFRDTKPKSVSSDEKIIEIWTNVFDTYTNLRKNASNYLYRIQKAEKENLFNTELFLEFKDTIIQYLGSFISELSRTKYKLTAVVESIDDEHIYDYIDSMIGASKANAILYDDYSPEKLKKSLKNKWVDLKVWFLGRNENISEIDVLYEKTNEAITMIVSYANRLSETTTRSQSRIEDYRTLAKRFYECGSLVEANLLFPSVFGVMRSRSLFGLDEIDINEDGNYANGNQIWDTDTIVFKTRNMSNGGPRGKTKATAIKNNRIEQQRRTIEKLEQRRKEEESIKGLIRDNKIIIEEVEELKPFQRKVILKWMKRTTKQRTGKQKRKKMFRSETGLLMRVNYRSGRKIKIKCSDGVLMGPDIEIIFEGEI